MVRAAEKPLTVVEPFDEKQFYLDEFRSKTLLFSVPASALAVEADYETLAASVRELLTNDTRVLLVVSAVAEADGEHMLRRLQRRLGPLVFRDDTLPLFPQKRARAAAFVRIEAEAFSADNPASAVLSALWSTLRSGPLFVGVATDRVGVGVHDLAQHVAARLRVHKLVLIESRGGLSGEDGKPLSFMDENLLTTLLSAGQAEWAGLADRRATLDAVRSALVGGVRSVNLCTLDGVSRELFTYEGSGTLFTLADYCTVERLGIDDFEEVERLIERGQREGLLKPRSADEIAALIVNGYGATIGARHLAGICALITAPYTAEHVGEIVGLYTITRFKGEGVGSKLVAQAVADARAAGLSYVFACTTEERAQAFFERQGFTRVTTADVPPAKWHAYDRQRKAVLAVFRMNLS